MESVKNYFSAQRALKKESQEDVDALWSDSKRRFQFTMEQVMQFISFQGLKKKNKTPNKIMCKYALQGDGGDVIDILNLTVEEDNGHLRSMRARPDPSISMDGTNLSPGKRAVRAF